jgi:hypothetical protein
MTTFLHREPRAARRTLPSVELALPPSQTDPREVAALVDEALVTIAGRATVPSAEVVDLLLDLRASIARTLDAGRVARFQ